MRRASNVDGNHGEIVAALRAVGCFVQSLAAVGEGCPDLLVIRAGRLWLLEVKDPRQKPSDRRLRQSQVEWHAKAGGVVHVVLTVDDAFRAIGVLPQT